MFGRRRWLVLVVLAAMLLAACGSSGADESDDPSGAGSSDAPASQDAETSDEPKPSQGLSDFPDVADGLFNTGTLHLEVRGDRSEDVDMTTTAFITGGNVFISGADEAGTAFVQIIWSSAEGSGGVSWGMKDILGAMELGDCSLDLSKNDPGGLAGTVDCDDTDGLEKGAIGLNLDVRIEFSTTP